VTHDPEGKPSRPRLTHEQADALSVVDASVALSSGAGCGKTTVLTERYLATLEPTNPSGPLSAVAMTFTEKAARELRKRIRDRAYAQLEQADDDSAIHWRNVVRSLEAAPISTFHEFCVGILRRHALRARIDPDFEVLDATIASVLRTEALGRCLRRWLAENDPALVDLAVEFGLSRVRDGLDALIDHRDAELLDQWVNRTEADLVAIWKDVWNRRGREAAMRPLLQAARECRQWFAAQPFEHPKLRALGAFVLGELLDLRDKIDRPEWLSVITKQVQAPRGLRMQDWPSPEVNDQCKKVMESFRKAIKAWEKSSTYDEQASLRAAGYSLQFAQLAVRARKAYDQAKRARGGLDFNDLILKTRDLLRSDPVAIRDDPARPITFVLVDEFQDTDQAQNEIVTLLAGEAHRTGGVFVVGDFKQSIYGFRGAQPRIFTELRDLFPSSGRLQLTCNFRSVPGVLDFVNALFVEAFPREDASLQPGPKPFPPNLAAPVEFVWCEAAPATAEKPPEKPDADESRRAEARALARLIRERLDAGWLIRDPHDERVRRAHAGDIAFLFRAMTSSPTYESALAAEGLDYHVVGGASFYARQEILDVVNVLTVIEDPNDPLALAAALRSPFFALSDEGLYLLGDSRNGDLAEGLNRCDELESLSSLDRERAIRARRMLEEWRSRKDRLSIGSLVDRVLDESGFEAALLGEFLGDRKRANARKLVRLARRFDSRGGFTLAHFVAQLREDLRKPPREDQAATTDEAGESIRLMSIHQAKGLEFPIVIVPDLNRKDDHGRDSVTFHEELGPLVNLAKASAGTDEDDDDSGDALGWKILRILERAEQEEELHRLFYVATTRARDVLILSSGSNPGAKPASAIMRLLHDRFDRATGLCRHSLPQGWATPIVRVTTMSPAENTHRHREGRKRPNLLAVANVITSIPVVSTEIARPARPRPRFVDLSEIPHAVHEQLRFQQLLRAILLDPGALDPARRKEVIRRLSRRLEPPASSSLTERIVRSLEPWIWGALGNELASATEQERGYDWISRWPPGSTESTVIHGRADFVAQGSSGMWSVVNFSTPGMDEARERLRLLLSARVVEHDKHVTVDRRVRIVLGEETWSVEEQDAPDTVIDELVTALWLRD
jgi:ATP-dependent helicase/nuclease subunit A